MTADYSQFDGSELLDTVRDTIERYVILPSEDAIIAVVLWVAATHAVDRLDHATRLAIHSPLKRCGKSRLMEVIAPLSHDAMQTTNVSVPALFRTIEAAGERPPTLFLDEADQIFGSTRKDEQNADLVAALNNGFRRGSPTYRCVGPKHTVQRFSTFAFAAVAGIGRLPGTIEDRAINITMRRRLPGEEVAKFRLRTDLPQVEEVGEALASWVSSAELVDEPSVPDALEDRAADAWEPMLAIADAAGGDWPERARSAAVRLSRETADDAAEQSMDVRLLSDVRSVLGNMTFLSTVSLLARLSAIEDAPWAEQDLSPRRLAIGLGKFGVKPRRNSTGTERGYYASDLRDPFSRYLPSEPSELSGVHAEQGRLVDTSDLSDGSTRQCDATRPHESAAQGISLTGLTLLTPVRPEIESPTESRLP
ncbi:MAG: DUF3631 domain-containing protein [Coriobacteriia bacterium]|nr:DUF3631 domain-containing protein [Coriobacteriia bacterium]